MQRKKSQSQFSFSMNLFLPLDTIRAAQLKENNLLVLEYTLRQVICVYLQSQWSGAVENKENAQLSEDL